MKLIVEDSYEAMSQRAAADLVTYIGRKEYPFLCTASGDSPKGMYRELADLVKNRKIDISNWQFLSLDEWIGLNGQDDGSCRFHLEHDLFGLLGVKKDQITFFDGRAEDPLDECQRIEEAIQEHNGIDVAIVGLGMNGHVGMNEPGTSVNSRTHIAEIHPVTQQVGQKYFKEDTTLTHGLTLGIQTLLDAKFIMLVVSGKKKAEIVKQVLTQTITNEYPASLLRNHQHFYVYLDKEAASEL